jgi:hypothetical protein
MRRGNHRKNGLYFVERAPLRGTACRFDDIGVDLVFDRDVAFLARSFAGTGV